MGYTIGFQTFHRQCYVRSHGPFHGQSYGQSHRVYMSYGQYHIQPRRTGDDVQIFPCDTPWDALSPVSSPMGLSHGQSHGRCH